MVRARVGKCAQLHRLKFFVALEVHSLIEVIERLLSDVVEILA
jgi:hypothetical protein